VLPPGRVSRERYAKMNNAGYRIRRISRVRWVKLSATRAHADAHGTVAELAAEEGEYQKATENFEQVAKKSMNNNLTKYSVKDYLFKAGIVHLASGVRRPSSNPTNSPLVCP